MSGVTIYVDRCTRVYLFEIIGQATQRDVNRTGNMPGSIMLRLAETYYCHILVLSNLHVELAGCYVLWRNSCHRSLYYLVPDGNAHAAVKQLGRLECHVLLIEGCLLIGK